MRETLAIILAGQGYDRRATGDGGCAGKFWKRESLIFITDYGWSHPQSPASICLRAMQTTCLNISVIMITAFGRLNSRGGDELGACDT